MRHPILFGFLTAAAALDGCGGGNAPTEPDTSLGISPPFASVEVDHSRQFTATIPGRTNPKVLWAVDGGSAKGDITDTGLYTAPANVPSPNLVVIRASSQTNPDLRATAVVEVKSASVAVSVHPTTPTVQIAQTQQFLAMVTGAEDTTVVWSVEGGLPKGTIDPAGLYTAPSVLPIPATATVRATSAADPLRYGTATVALRGPGPGSGEFVLVPSGTFWMGDGWSYCAVTTYRITLTEDFYLGQTEVTNQEYLEAVQWAYDHGYVAATETSVTDALGGSRELLDLDGPGSEIAFRNGVFTLRDAGHGLNPDHPVTVVTWYGAAAFCDWMSLRDGLPQAYDHATWQCNGGDPYRAQGYRLPTEAEWEHAAKYNDGRLYPWGDEAPTCDRANYGGCNDGWTEPVGTQALGPEKMIGDEGLFDMAGNVWEWCNDRWQCEPDPSPQDPPGPVQGTTHVLKGGSYWQTQPEIVLRCSCRTYSEFGSSRFCGFRTARTADP